MLRTTGWVALACVGCCAAPFLAPLVAGGTLATIWASDFSLATILVAGGVIAFGAAIVSKSSSKGDANEPALCRLPRADRAQRTSEFRALFSAGNVLRERTPQGVRWTLPAGPDTETESLRLAALEERCCDGIKVQVRREGKGVVWDITGPSSVSNLLDAFYELPALIASDAGAEQLWSTLDASACGPSKS